ncbi:MAG: hypothetical protein NVSMB19_13720 [Vulcanimicrobiaceae bacterium]
MKRPPVGLLAAGGVLAALVIGIFSLHGPLIATGVSTAVRLAGYTVRYDALHVAPGHLIVTHPDVSSLHGEPVFTAQTIDVAYDAGAIFKGPYLYGITGIEIDRPKVTIVHHRDGSYNIVLPASQSGGASKPFVLPQIHVVVKDGTVGIVDDTKIFRHSRRLSLQNIQADVDVDPHAVSHFVFGTTLVEEGGKFPIAGRGTLDPKRGYELARVRARSIGLAPLLDFALNSTSLHIANGVLNDVDARVYGLLDRTGALTRHVSVSAKLDHFQPYLNSLAKPLRDGRGTLRVYDDGLAIPKVDGSIAGVPVRISGGIYDLAHPTLRLGIVGKGELRRLLTLASGATALPVRGPIAFKLLVEGDATAPQTLATFRSPRLYYDRIPLDAPHGLVALNGPETAIVRSSLHYAGIDVGARGRVVSAKHTDTELLAVVDAPSARLPYATDIFGDMLLHGAAIVSGTDTKLGTRGLLAGDTATQHLASAFAFDPDGTGTAGPLTLTGPGDRALYARAVFEEPGAKSGAAFVSARHFRLSTRGPQPVLPGLAVVAVPALDGTLDANIAASFGRDHYTVGGDAHLANAHVLGYTIEDLTARARVTDGAHVALDARYRGSLAALNIAKGGVALRGRADIPLSLVASSASDALVQIDGARFADASIGTVPLQRLSATIGVRGTAYDVYAARARLGGNDIVAQGSFGDGGTLHVSSGGVNLAALRGLGLPATSGSVTALADVSGSLAVPHVAGGVAVRNAEVPDARLEGFPVNANSTLTFDGDRLALSDALVSAGPTVGSLDGTVTGLRGDPARARYAFDAHVRQADIATLARLAAAPLQYPEGSLDADVRVAGRGTSPAVAGRITIPEGSLNGLRFRGASVALAGTPAALRATDGRITVGTSHVGFSADIAAAAQAVALHAPRVDLADFNDYFDRGDTLGGTGNIDVTVRNARDALATRGRIRLAHTRVRRFDLGETRADWVTTGRTVHTALALGGVPGRVTESGDVTLAATQPLRDALHRTNLALVTRATGVDLGVWLPAIGVQAPVIGKVDANATIRGRYPAIGVVAHAALADGILGRVPVRSAALDVRAANGRATISNALLAIDNLDVTASGSAGLAPAAPLDLTIAARTANTGALAKTVTGATYDTSGSVATTLHLTGSFARPRADDVLDATDLRYARYTVPHAHLEANVDRTRATLRTATVDLQSGRVVASGFAPLGANYALGTTGPVALSLAVANVTLGQFAALLPKGTRASGSLDGSIALGGTIAVPSLAGTLALANGTFVGPELRSRLSNARAQLTFAGTTATLHDASASVGGGVLALDGTASVPSLRAPDRNLAYALHLRSENAVLDAPAYLRGRVNGTLDLVRAANATPVLGGNVAFTSTRVPLSTIFNPNAPQPTATAKAFDLALNLGVDVGRDVRVQGGPADIGAQGRLQIGGTLAAPTAAGELESTGGTLSFYRTFRLEYPSTIVFDPSNGVIPTIDATANTTVDNPQTDVTLHVTGPATQLDVALTSSPNYSREQILGLLVGAQALGAVSGVQTAANGGPQINPFQAAAEGQLGSLLTRNILEPFSSQLGGAVGLSNLAINYNVGGSVSIGAQKKIFKNVNAVFAESFNTPPRESIGLVASPNDATAIQLTFFSQPSSNRFDSFEGARSLQSTNPSVTSVQPARGSSGFSFSFQRKFR